MSVHGLCEQALAESQATVRYLIDELAEARSECAAAVSEAMWWRERIRELAEEFRVVAARDAVQLTTDRVAVRVSTLRACADDLDSIVTEAETGRNGTATPGGHDGTTTG